MNIHITKRAQAEYLRIVDLFLEYSGPLSAEGFINCFEEKVLFIRKYPEAGFPEPLLRGRRHVYRAKLINKNYKIVYYITSNNVWISDIWDMRRDPQRLVERLK